MMRPWTPRRRLDLATEICGCGFSGCKRDALYDRFHECMANGNDYFDAHGKYSVELEDLTSAAYAPYVAEDKACDERYSHNERMRLSMMATARTRATFAQAIALGMAQVYNNSKCGATMLCGGGSR